MKVTMTLGEFRELTKLLPDDSEIFLDEGDIQFHEARFGGVLGSTKDGLPPAIRLEMGQVWNAERDIETRIDDWLDRAV